MSQSILLEDQSHTEGVRTQPGRTCFTYIDLLKNGTVVDRSLVWNHGMHSVTHYV